MIDEDSQNLDLNDHMLSELESIDPFSGLPAWTKIVDRREANSDRKERDESIISFIDSTSSGIIEKGIDTDNVLDDEVRTWMIKIILMADRQRERMKLSPYSKDSILTLVYEIWYTVHLHRNNFRQSGENYAKSHLFESVINAIRDHGVSDIFTIVSILRHDDLEDHKKLGFSEPRLDLLLCLQHYQYLLTGEEMPTPIEDQIAHFRKEVISTVKAVSIYRKFSDKQQKHELNFRRALEALCKYGMRPTNVRLAERSHNHSTIDAKPVDEATAYLKHSLKVYPAFAEFLDLDRAKDTLMTTAYKYLEPDILTAFNLKSLERLNKRFGVRKDKSKLLSLLKKVGRSQFIKFLAVNPRKISHYVKGGEAFESLNDISENDPMFEIVILVDNKDDIPRAKDRISSYLRTSSEFLDMDLDYSEDITPQRGLRLEILNPDLDPELGGYYKVRINTVEDEAKLDQGRFGRSDKKEEYEDSLGPVKEVLERTERSASGILELVDEIGHGKNDIFTLDRHKISIPVGGTTLAFGAKINTKLLREIRGSRIEEKRENKHGEMRRVWVPISPLDRLKHKSRIKIIKEGDPDFDPQIDTYNINYAWFEFAKSLDSQAIRKHFNGLGETERTAMLGEYMLRLSNIFGLEDFELLQVLLSNCNDADVKKRFYKVSMIPNFLQKFQTDLDATDDPVTKEKLTEKIRKLHIEKQALLVSFESDLKKILSDIVRGHFSPLKILSNAAEAQIANAEEKGEDPIEINENNPLVLYFEVPDRAGVGEEILNECKKIGVNFRFIEQKRISAKGFDRLEFSLDITSPKTRIYDLLLVLLKLSERYKCVVLSDTFKKLVPNFQNKPVKTLAPQQ